MPLFCGANRAGGARKKHEILRFCTENSNCGCSGGSGRWGVLLAVLWFAGVFWFRRRSFRQFRRQSRRCGYDDFALLCGEDRVRENCRRFGVLLAALLLAVPACWGMWSSRVYLTAAAPAQTQAETTAQLHEKKFLPGFAEDAWETASLDSKTELAK